MLFAGELVFAKLIISSDQVSGQNLRAFVEEDLVAGVDCLIAESRQVFSDESDQRGTVVTGLFDKCLKRAKRLECCTKLLKQTRPLVNQAKLWRRVKNFLDLSLRDRLKLIKRKEFRVSFQDLL